jgi:two-component system LytT family response regulator
VNARDYLLKPIRPERLRHAVGKLTSKAAAAPARSGPKCEIRCFGSFEILINQRSIKWSRSRARELLAYLLHQEGKWISKYKLCDELWPNYTPERALAYLQICLHTLRKTLREAGCTQIAIEFSNHKYLLSVRDVEWDARQYQAQYELSCKTRSMEAAVTALSYYRGEYLDGEDWQWASLPREAYICQADRLRQALEDAAY